MAGVGFRRRKAIRKGITGDFIPQRDALQAWSRVHTRHGLETSRKLPGSSVTRLLVYLGRGTLLRNVSRGAKRVAGYVTSSERANHPGLDGDKLPL